MERIGSLFLVCVALALTGAYDAQAQSKKKGKEPDLAISKRGELMFEDEFSGKELQWLAIKGEWQVVNKTLLTRAMPEAAIKRSFSPKKDVTFQFRSLAPRGCALVIAYGATSSPATPAARIHFGEQEFYLYYHSEGDGKVRMERAAVSDLSYPKPRWVPVVFEILGEKYALTVDGKTITHDIPNANPIEKSQIVISVGKTNTEVFAIDDVKVWEALPKDEEDEKDKKKRK